MCIRDSPCGLERALYAIRGHQAWACRGAAFRRPGLRRSPTAPLGPPRTSAPHASHSSRGTRVCTRRRDGPGRPDHHRPHLQAGAWRTAKLQRAHDPRVHRGTATCRQPPRLKYWRVVPVPGESASAPLTLSTAKPCWRRPSTSPSRGGLGRCGEPATHGLHNLIGEDVEGRIGGRGHQLQGSTAKQTDQRNGLGIRVDVATDGTILSLIHI